MGKRTKTGPVVLRRGPGVRRIRRSAAASAVSPGRTGRAGLRVRRCLRPSSTATLDPPGERLLALHAALFQHLPGERGRAGRYQAAGLRGRSDRDFLSEPVALRPPGPLLIPSQMETLAAWLPSRLSGGEFHPLLVVAAYLLEFLAIRPFADGNGRVGRLLTNLLLLRCGHAYLPYGSLDAAIHARREEYYFALRRSQASRNLPRPDISPWLLAFLDALEEMQRLEANEVIARLPGADALRRTRPP